LSSLTCHHISPLCYTFTTHWLTYYTNHSHLKPSAMPVTSILHHNSETTPKHTQGLQNLTAYSSSPTPFSSIYQLSKSLSLTK
jgi:hypothetical protein